MNGYIVLHRKIQDHWLWKDAERFQWWVDLLFMANFEDKEVMDDSHLFVLKRGQLIASVSFLSIRWGKTAPTIIKFLKLLQKNGMILRETLYRQTPIVTICNYDTYQLSMDKGVYTQVNRQVYTQVYTIKENKENNNKNNSSLRSELQKDGFEEFWQAYGYKKSKETARKAWRNLSQKDRNAAMQAIPAYREDCERCQRSMQYPATYLHKRTWEDDYNVNDYGTNSNSKQQGNGYVRQPTPSENIEAARSEQLHRIAELDSKAEVPTFDVFPKL